MALSRVVLVLLPVLLAMASVADAAPVFGLRRVFGGNGRSSGRRGGRSRTSFGSVGVVGNQIHPDPYVNVGSVPFPGVPLFAI